MTKMFFIVMNGFVSERMATATVLSSSVTGVEEEEVVDIINPSTQSRVKR